ncbi:MAG TPA: hypothetical protein VGL00_05575, partial [Terracidiphilus sp.]
MVTFLFKWVQLWLASYCCRFPVIQNRAADVHPLIRFDLFVSGSPVLSPSQKGLLSTAHHPGIVHSCAMPQRQNDWNRMQTGDTPRAFDSPVERELRPGHLMRANPELSRRKSIYLAILPSAHHAPSRCISAFRIDRNALALGAPLRGSTLFGFGVLL